MISTCNFLAQNIPTELFRYYWFVYHFALKVFLFIQENQNHFDFQLYYPKCPENAIIITFVLWSWKRFCFLRFFSGWTFSAKKMWSGNCAIKNIDDEFINQPFNLCFGLIIQTSSYRKSRCISRVFETTNCAKLLDFDLYTDSKSIWSITKNTRCCAWF